jgi:predicted Zn-dependent protease
MSAGLAIALAATAAFAKAPSSKSLTPEKPLPLPLSQIVGVGDLAQSPSLPPLKPHRLPPTLAQWQDSKQSGNYFDQIKTVSVGYLVWSHFPVTVYLEPLTSEEAKYPFATKRAETWTQAVTQAIQEWNQYLPLRIVNLAEGADITVRRSPPPIQFDLEESTSTGSQQTDRPNLPISRARSAETRFELYAKAAASGQSPILTQRFTVQLRPDQAPSYLVAAARHELGHALGIWGHSPLQTDALYFSQVRQSPPISARDVNTLKHIYEQPTRLGWALPEGASGG